MSESFAYHTDLEWFQNILNTGNKNEINFWKTDRPINLIPGELFFMKNHKKFIGMGNVNRVERGVTIKDAWARYGLRNGALGLEAMINLISEVLDDKSANGNYKITCIILDNFSSFLPFTFQDVDIPNFQTSKILTDEETQRVLNHIDRS